ncbi:MAG: thioredoxin [Nitrososphaeria archaeon]|nr:thioredoxin [Nitrososphaeria archaeon]
MTGIIELDESNFMEFVSKKAHSLVYFWAPWCNPCKHMAPIVEKISKKYEDQINIGKVNVSSCPEIASKYFVAAVPTFILFREGTILEVLVGAVSERRLDNMIKGFVREEEEEFSI